MAISSVSKVHDAPDPVLETDLELLAKVNTYQQTKFDAGAEALQQEVNKWAMMSNIAKPELRDYANQKLNNLVNGINSMGGINLSDINSVNSLKSLGYNIYGDQRIMDGVVTTQKMRALQADASKKMSGKDAGKYDPTVAQYLMKGYNDWASDGNADNTKFDGPVELPMGNMTTINGKVLEYLKQLKPDSDSTPSGDMQKSYGYFQVEGKWLKGDRVQEAINAVVDQNDALVFKAHGWSSLAGDTDKGLVSKLNVLYDGTDARIKNQVNYLQAELNQTTNAGRKVQLQQLISQQKQALAANANERNSWSAKAELSPQEREGIQESLYRNAWQSNVVNSFSYNQEKKELKSNMPLIFHDRMQQQAYQWSQDYNLRVADFGLKEKKLNFEIQKEKNKNSLGFSLNDPFGLPLHQRANTGDANQLKNPKDFMDKISATYFKMNADYYNYMYNIMGANDTAGRFVQDDNKQWKPKVEYKDQIEQELGLLNSKLDNYSNLTDAERQALNLPTDADELQSLFAARNKINSYKAYHQMAEEKESEIIRNAISTGSIEFDWRNVPLTIGANARQTTVGEALALYDAGVLNDETAIAGVGLKPGSTKPYFETTDINFKKLKKMVEGMRSDASKSYEKVGGRIFNTFDVPIPFANIPKMAQEVMQKQLSDKVVGVDYKSIQPLLGYIDMNFETGEPRYMMSIQSGEGKKLKTEEVDVSEYIKSSPNSGIGVYFPKSDMSLIWGLNLSSNGATPFAKTDNYKNALRTTVGNYPYQVSTMNNNVNGTSGLKVKVALPVGNGNTVEVNVKNFQNGSTTFPTSLEAVQQYLDQWMSSPELKARFYQEHGLTLPTTQ
jgi:hypothetical protein